MEHVYCLKDGKTGWQNLYIGNKNEKRLLVRTCRNYLSHFVYYIVCDCLIKHKCMEEGRDVF